MNNDVICAISTPPGMGAIATVRLSGEGCIALTDKVFLSPSGKKLIESKANRVHFGRIIYNNEILDEVLVTIFHSPHSFTGEEMVEIHAHAGPLTWRNHGIPPDVVFAEDAFLPITVPARSRSVLVCVFP